MPQNPDFMTIAEVAAHTRMTKGGLANLRSLGVGGPPYLRLTAKTIVYRRADVEAWLDAAVRTGTAA